jgi:tetratricopeptide (TPR) repeat protein
MAISRTQLTYLAGAVLLAVALYLSIGNSSDISSTKESSKEGVASGSFEERLTIAKARLKRQEADRVSGIEKQLDQSENDTALLAQLGRTWDELGDPSISSFYFEAIAKTTPGESEWLNAAYRYFDAFKMSEDSVSRSVMVQKAIDCYNEVLEINPQNLNAKTDLGVCYAEGTANPMQGISLLREVVQTNPEHENAQFNLGILSVKSGQLEKAVDRFAKVQKINPSNFEAVFLMGRCYMQLGKNTEAIAALENVKNGSKNPQLVEEANKLLNQISTNQ